MKQREEKLKERVKASYDAYIQHLKEKPASDLIELASEIAATKFVYEELMVAGYFPDCTDYLMQADDPLKKAVDCWLEDQDFDRHEDLSHALWMAKEIEINRGLYTPDSEAPAFSQGVTMC